MQLATADLTARTERQMTEEGQQQCLGRRGARTSEAQHSERLQHRARTADVKARACRGGMGACPTIHG